MIKHLPKRVKRFMVQYELACILLWEYGERATPGKVKFVWDTVEPDFEEIENDPRWRWGALV